MGLPSQRQDKIKRTLADIHDPHERLAVATGWKWNLPPAAHREENLVRGCVSRVWIEGRREEGRCHFAVDAESPLVRGLARMMCGIYDGATAEEIVTEQPAVLEEAGLLRNLSPTRQNGMAAVRRALVDFAQKTAEA
ncbi:MAG TPA: SufE family protein [Chthoniobacteraceae bacterium]|jgi:cysteine desulfuration protein SufE|nr:SufE family protein [Chthoniobacteraceae bacterium]